MPKHDFVSWQGPHIFNAQSFITYAEQCLAPMLSPGDVVIMDNLSSRKKPAIGEAIRAVGRKAALPAAAGLVWIAA